MAVYHLKASFGSRAGGQSARAKCDYIEREGRYERDREELEYKEHGNMPKWAEDDPRSYWEAADEHERSNGRLYSEVQFALPKELNEAERRELASGFAGQLTGPERLPYTLAIHRGDGENPPAHPVFSERVHKQRWILSRSPLANGDHLDLVACRRNSSDKGSTYRVCTNVLHACSELSRECRTDASLTDKLWLIFLYLIDNISSVFKVMITKEASRRLRGMPDNAERTIVGKIDSLAVDPFAPNNNVTALKVTDGFRLRVGDWRVLYTLDTKARTMTIAAIVPRGGAYR